VRIMGAHQPSAQNHNVHVLSSLWDANICLGRAILPSWSCPVGVLRFKLLGNMGGVCKSVCVLDPCCHVLDRSILLAS